MECPHCGKPQKGVCLDCDSHFFQVGMTLRNESAPILIKQREQDAEKRARDAEKKKTDDEIKKLRNGLTRLRLVITLTISVTISVSLLYWTGKNPKPAPPPCAEQKTIITRPISFNSEERLAPGEWVTGDFPIEEYRRVTINVMAECKDYVDGSLRISLLDDYNYWMFESGQLYDVIDTIGARSYSFSDGLYRGRYYIVLQNTSEVQEIVIKVNASLSYEQDNPNPCSQEMPAANPDPKDCCK